MKIEPTYLTFEQSKLIKQKGFKQIEMPSYLLVSYENVNVLKINPNNLKIGDLIGYYIPEKTVNAPEQWKLVEWLRIKHGIWVRCNSMNGVEWYCDIWNFKGKPNTALTQEAQIIFSDKEYKTPQKAYSAAFDYILKELI